MVLLKEIFEKLILRNPVDVKKKNMKNYQVGNVLSFLVCFQDELRIVISTRDHLVRAVSGNLKYVLGYPVVSKLNKFEP